MSDEPRTTPIVLLVGSEEGSTKTFRRTFEKVALHWQQVHVADGGEAVHYMVYQGFPDLVITPCESPKLNALDLVEWVRSMKCPRLISFIIWDKIISPQLRADLRRHDGIDFLHQEMPEVRLKKALMQIVAKTEMALLSPASKAEKSINSHI
jgi:CheY-like chemotaxis protein